MPDFLKAPIAAELASPSVVAIRLSAALILGVVVAWVYRRTRAPGEVTGSFSPTLVMLAVLIAMVTQVVGTNAARAFALVGALSIVRFRTVVRDTQDTAYVIFAVVVGMAAGAGDPWVALIGLVVVTLAAFLMRTRPSSAANGDDPLPFLLRVRIGLGTDVKTLLGGTLDAFLTDRRLLGMETAKQGVSIDVSYEVRLRSADAAEGLVKALNRLEGVQDVRLERREELLA